MPTVLQNPNLAPSAKQVPLSGAFQTPNPPDFFGVAPINPTARGQGVANLGRGITQFSKNLKAMQQRVDTTAAEEQLVKFEREKNDLFFNDTDGYFNAKGRDAFDRAKPFTERLDELQKTHTQELSSENSRNMFIRATNSQLTKARADVMRKASSEFDAWENATMASRIQSSLDDASLFIDDFDQLTLSLESGRQNVMDLALKHGNSPETVEQDIRRFNAKFATNAIDAALDKDAVTAQKMLFDMKELLDGLDINDIQGKIDKLFRIEKGQEDSRAAVTIAESLVTEHAENPNARANIIEQVNLIEDPELQQKAMRESMYQFNQFKIAGNERRAASFDAAEKFEGSVEEFITENPRAWDDLTKTQQNQIKTGTAVVTNFKLWSELQLMDDSELAKIDPTDPAYTTGLSKGDRNKLLADVEKARAGDPERTLGRTIAAQTKSAIEKMIGKDSVDWSRKQSETADVLYAIVNSEAQFRTEAKGSRLNSTEYTNLLQEMNREVVINRSKLIPGSTTLNITDVPSTELRRIASELNSRGIAATADNIIRVYEDGN